MSFGTPAVLLGLLAIPLLAWWYVARQRQRGQAAAAFVAPQMTESVAPRRPRWRRHVPMLAFALALAVLIVAAARPQRSVAKPITDGAVMLVDDISSSMQATDVAPSRLGAAERAANRFLSDVPSTLQVGLVEFASTPNLLQSPSANHALTRRALAQVPKTTPGTAVGEALTTAPNSLRSVPKIDGKRPPGAIVLISDGASNVGLSPLTVARQAAAWAYPDLHRLGRDVERDDPDHQSGTTREPPACPSIASSSARIAQGFPTDEPLPRPMPPGCGRPTTTSPPVWGPGGGQETRSRHFFAGLGLRAAAGRQRPDPCAGSAASSSFEIDPLENR